MTTIDFDQTTLSEYEIESDVSGIMKHQKSKSLLEVTTPVNTKKLSFLGKIHPT